MIASKKLRTRTVLASIPKGLPMAKTVLIVDDNALIRQALCEMFKRNAGDEWHRSCQYSEKFDAHGAVDYFQRVQRCVL